MRVRLLLAAVAVLLGVAAPVAPAHVPVEEGDIGLRFAESPRLVSHVPVVVDMAGPGTVSVTGVVNVRGRRVARTGSVATRPFAGGRLQLSLRSGARSAVARAARRAGSEPQLVVTATATITGRTGAVTAVARSALRRAPFYDAPLTTPDAPATQGGRFAVAFDLPFLFRQVTSASGAPALGAFRKSVAAREGAPRCTLTLGAVARTATRAPSRSRSPVVERGRAGRAWDFVRGTTDAVVTATAPEALPGSRRWLVVRFAIRRSGDREACRGELRRGVPAVLRRVVRTVAVRAAAPEPGPGGG